MLKKIPLPIPRSQRIPQALIDNGWFRSFKEKEAIDAQGKPVAWYTYGMLHFLEPRLKKEFTVFEYGTGNSTRWYASRVKEVVCVEDDAEWVAKIKPTLPANASLELIQDKAAYVGALAATERQFDIVVIDAKHRNECAEVAAAGLKPGGVIIYDNTNRDSMKPGQATLLAQGFRQLRFHGMVPIMRTLGETSVSYRDNNCLQI